jgi:ferredoxin--NADP+ reductase
MFRITRKRKLAADVTCMEIEAPAVAKKAKPGQFVVIIVDEKGERIPLTLAGWDAQKGLITIIFQELGYTTKKLGALKEEQYVLHILGPLGEPTKIKKIGQVICIAGGVGIAEVYPVSRAFKEAGNKVTGIIGSRNKDLLILEKEMKQVCDELHITTDDGSYGKKGFVTDVLSEILTDEVKLVYAIGPVPMMKAVAKITKDQAIPTLVSLNPIMVDATGMCGSCRCTVGGKSVFGCVDGPEFDGHQVDFDELDKRLKLFKEQEKSKG